MRGRFAWMTFVAFDALATFFGSSYIWWPSKAVLDHGGTEGILQVERHAWGAYVMASGVLLIVLASTAYRQGRRWAWYAMFYQFAFFLSVAAIEPDWLFPIVFAILCAVAMWRMYPRFFPTRKGLDAETGGTHTGTSRE